MGAHLLQEQEVSFVLFQFMLNFGPAAFPAAVLC